jgi:amino acid transporter
MSGDLKHPSKAIPKGTLSGLLLTFLAYAFVIFSLAATITRESFYRNVNLIQEVGAIPYQIPCLILTSSSVGERLRDRYFTWRVCNDILFLADGCHWFRETSSGSRKRQPYSWS